MLSRGGAAGSSQPCRRAVWIIVTVLVVAVGLARPANAALFVCASGDVPCLVAAINTSNANGEVNLIRLDSGTYTLTAVNNDTDGSNGLPSITSPLTIGGNGSGNTIIERAATAPLFRVFHVGQSGSLNLEDLTVRGGRWGGPVNFGGGGILNLGTTIITHSAVTNNLTNSQGGGSLRGGGGGIASLGRLFVAGSTVADNIAGLGPGGAIFSPAAVTVINSTIRGNTAEDGGGGIAITTAAGSVTIIGSTIVDNASGGSHGGGLYTESSTVAVVNSTVAHNGADFGFGGGLFVAGGVVVNTTIANNDSSDGRALAGTSTLALHNTIVSGPSEPTGFACHGKVTSLDNNIFFDPACAVALLPHDRTGDPGLGDFIDFGAPGRGFFLLSSNSQALDAGDNAACLPADQRGRLRSGGCDIGAIEGTTP
jgi:hypothetical protein